MIYFDDILVDHNGETIVDHNAESIIVPRVLRADAEDWSIRRDGDTFTLYIDDVYEQEKEITGVASPITLSALMQLVFFTCRRPYQINNFYIADHILGVDPDAWQPVPRSMEEVRVTVDDVLIFGGLIQSVTSPTFSSSKEVKLYNLSVGSWESVLNNRLISDVHTSQTTKQIVTSLFNDYIFDEGFTLGKISIDNDGIVYSNYNYSNARLYDILQELATEINASFMITPDRQFYFVSRSEFPIITVPEHIKAVKLDEETGELRNVQIITGVTEETALQTESVTWVTDQSFFTVAYPVARISEITVNGDAVDFGINGIDSKDPTKVFLFTFANNTINYNTESGVVEASDVVVIKYYGRYEASFYVENGALIQELQYLNGTSGRIENLLNDDTLVSLDDAAIKANALLDQYNERDQKISLTTHDLAASAILNQWPLELTDQNISGSYVVTERTVQLFGVDGYTINCNLAKKNFVPGYAKILKRRSKSVGKDSTIFKRSITTQNIRVVETMIFERSGMVSYPVDSTDMVDPFFDEFFPVRV